LSGFATTLSSEVVEVQRVHQHPDLPLDPSGRVRVPRHRRHGARHNLVVQARRRRRLANLMMLASSVFVLAGAAVCYLLLK
jgi:hypothetical protein